MKRVIVIVLLALSLSGELGAQVNIWEGTKVRAKVCLTPYPAAQANSPGCIICPGGSYFWLSRDDEGHTVAKRLQSEGISAFVLEYRVAGVGDFITRYRLLFRGHRHPQMIQDAQRSLQLVRQNAQAYHIDPEKLGVMGFSAGGHLSIMTGEFFDTDFLSLVGCSDTVSLRPSFIAPIYPVVTLNGELAHRRSRRGLLAEGHTHNQTLRDSLSLEKHVREDMPPVFLMNCEDDPTVRYQNSELLDSALTEKGVSHKYIQYSIGGHGFGGEPTKASSETAHWMNEFLKWIREIFEDGK